MHNIIILSNNSLVKEKLSTYSEIIFIQGSLLETLQHARDLIHKGYKLLTHPLSGSVKPNITPYKTIALKKKEGKLDLDSLMLIEESISRTISLLNNKDTPDWPEKYLQDFRLIDYDLIKNALKL